jgi:hypothetical protein
MTDSTTDAPAPKWFRFNGNYWQWPETEKNSMKAYISKKKSGFFYLSRLEIETQGKTEVIEIPPSLSCGYVEEEDLIIKIEDIFKDANIIRLYSRKPLDSQICAISKALVELAVLVKMEDHKVAMVKALKDNSSLTLLESKNAIEYFMEERNSRL